MNGFEWVCSGDDFFLNGFAPVFDRWPGFQIGGVDWLIGGVDQWPGLGFLSVARFLNGFVFVFVCGLALLLGCVCVWLCCWFDVCVCVCGCGDGFGYVDQCINGCECVCCVLNRC